MKQGVRLVTWNVKWLFDSDPSDQPGVSKEVRSQWPSTEKEYWQKLYRTAQVLVALNADVYALQEVEDREVLEDLKTVLEANLNRPFWVCFVPGRDRHTFQNVGVITSLPVKRFYRFSRLKQGVSKHLVVHLRVKGEELRLVTCHLKAGRDQEDLKKRCLQAKSLHEKIARWVKKGKNVVVLGDLNTLSHYGQRRKDADYYLRGLHTPSPRDDLVDLHHFLPFSERATHRREGELDRILLSKSAFYDHKRWKDLSFHRVGRFSVPPSLSDHAALWAELLVK